MAIRILCKIYIILCFPCKNRHPISQVISRFNEPKETKLRRYDYSDLSLTRMHIFKKLYTHTHTHIYIFDEISPIPSRISAICRRRVRVVTAFSLRSTNFGIRNLHKRKLLVRQAGISWQASKQLPARHYSINRSRPPIPREFRLR